MLVGLPSIQQLLFGYAIRTEVRHVPMVVLDQSDTQESRTLTSVLDNTPISARTSNEAAAPRPR
jgi:ABC-2 type transport system permease protein